MKRNIVASAVAIVTMLAMLASPYSTRAAFSGVLPVASTNSTPAAVAITMSGYTLNANQSALVTFTFPIAPASFTTSDITADNGVISNLLVSVDPKVYTAIYTPNEYISDATNTISVSARVSASTYTTAGGTIGISYDGTNMWASNGYANSISKITQLGVVTTYTGLGTQPFSLAFDGINMWTGNNAGSSVSKITSGGVVTNYSSIGQNIYGIAFDGTNMWTANYGADSVSKVAPNGSKTTYTGTGGGPWGIAYDGSNMWTANYNANNVTKIASNGSMTNYTISGMTGPMAIAFDGAYIWTGNAGNSTVSRIASDGSSVTYSSPSSIYALAYDGTNMWGATYADNSVIKIASNGTMTEYSIGSDLYPHGIAFDGTNIWTANNAGSVTKISQIAGASSLNFTVNTLVAPIMQSSSSANVQSSSANVSSGITASGGATITGRGFDYGKTTSYGSTISSTGSSFSTGSYSDTISGLECGTTYHYRSYAVNSIDTGVGSDATLTTQSCGGGGAAPVISAAASSDAPLDFSIISTTPTQAKLKLNANPASVSGYIASTDSTFSDTGIIPYPADGIGTVSLANSNSGSSQTIYLKYVSISGHQSAVISNAVGKSVVAVNVPKNTNKTILTRTLSLGMKGNDVEALQAYLEKEKLLVMPKGAARGYFGSMTKAAVGKFQIKHNIVASAKSSGYGTAGPLTRKMIQP